MIYVLHASYRFLLCCTLSSVWEDGSNTDPSCLAKKKESQFLERFACVLQLL